MMDMFKKSLAFGMGAASFSADRLKVFVDDMVARGEMSSEEAKRFVDDVSNQADEEKKNIEGWMREQASKMLQQAGAAEAYRVENLEKRIAALERRVAELSEEDIEDSACCVCEMPSDVKDKEGTCYLETDE